MAKVNKKIINQNMVDYQKEKNFAIQILLGKKSLAEFEYIVDYVSTIKLESKKMNPDGLVLFVGSGPIPLSAMLLADEGFNVDCLDFSNEAVLIGREIIKKFGYQKRIQIIAGDARLFNNYSVYDTIVLALEAGVNYHTKKEILEKIFTSMKPDGLVLVRSSNEKNSEGSYVNSSSYLENFFHVEQTIQTFSGYCSTKVCKMPVPHKADLI